MIRFLLIALFILFFIYYIVFLNILAETDPCVSFQYLHKSEYRGDKCPLQPNRPICDWNIQAGWYRITGDATIVNYPLGLRKCATLYTIWMNGI